MLAQAAYNHGEKVGERRGRQTQYALDRLPLAALALAAVCTFNSAAVGEERGPLANDRYQTWIDKLAEQPRVLEIRRRFPQAAIQLAKRVEGDRLAFEIVADDRELAAGFVNVESGKVRFFDEGEQRVRQAEEREAEVRESEARTSNGFWRAFREACRWRTRGWLGSPLPLRSWRFFHFVGHWQCGRLTCLYCPLAPRMGAQIRNVSGAVRAERLPVGALRLASVPEHAGGRVAESGDPCTGRNAAACGGRARAGGFYARSG